MPNAYTRTRITLTETERAALTSMARSRSFPAALALRARIVLACEGDRVSTDVAAQLGINRGAVTRWRGRYAHLRIAGLYDELRPGRPHTVDNERVAELIAKTLHTNGHVSSFDSPFFAATSSVAFWPLCLMAVPVHRRTAGLLDSKRQRRVVWRDLQSRLESPQPVRTRQTLNRPAAHMSSILDIQPKRPKPDRPLREPTDAHTACANRPTPSLIFATSAVAKLRRRVAGSGLAQ